MANITTTNISKYVLLNDFLLLEYEFNRDGQETVLSDAFVVDTCIGLTKAFYESNNAIGLTNNALKLNSIPTNTQRTSWLIDTDTPEITYQSFWSDSSVQISQPYKCDTIKLHVIAGYNFEDVGGFLLQVRADSENGLVDLSNFTYIKQLSGSEIGDVIKFSPNTLFLGNRFYDKYIEFKVPSVHELGLNTPSTLLGDTLGVKNLSDVYITYSTIFDVIKGEFVLDEIINVQLPVESVADKFNCFIAESTEGDYIEYYATWENDIIGEYMGEIESGRIRLYTSNNPNDNYESFVDSYGPNARKWVIIHEIDVLEQIPPSTSLLTQRFSFTQDSNFSEPNYFRPILKNSDIDATYMIQYTCRLVNRMDGTQIIRKASFSSNNPKKYGLRFTRLNVDNIIPYKIFNKIESEKPNINMGSSPEKVKYVKVFYDTVSVVMNAFNEVFPQGTGPLFLKSYDSVYKFKFEKIDTNGNKVNVDLSGAYNYALLFKLDDNTKIEISPTYSTNMNTTIGEIEFKITEDQSSILQKQKKNTYSIIIKNPNGTSYTFYEGVYYPLSRQDEVIQNYKSMYTVTDLQNKVTELQTEVERLKINNNLI